MNDVLPDLNTWTIAGLILAAGAGVRFGTEPKQLAPLHGRPLLEWAVTAQCAVAALDPIVVVLGAHAAEIEDAVDLGRAQAVVCDDWDAGQAASLRCGLAALPGAARIVVTLGDAPFVTSEVIALFAGAPPGTRAVYDGRPGHPVVLGPEHVTAMTAVGGDRGARGLLRDAARVEVGDRCSGLDVDTPEDLAAALRHVRAARSSSPAGRTAPRPRARRRPGA